jgi:hypothetical protein
MMIAVFFLLWPSAGQADSIIPPIIVVWPAVCFLFLPVVFIEAALAVCTLRIPFGEGIRISFWANLLSTLVGLPIGTCFNPVPLVLARRWDYGAAPDLVLLVSLPLSLYLVSVVAEAWVARRLLDESHRQRAWRWAWLANLATYTLIWGGLAALAMTGRLGSLT